MTCNIIVQARMGSTRFPGKVMQDCNGKPMIGVLMDRLEEARAVAGRLVVVMPGEEEKTDLARYVEDRRDWRVVYTKAAGQDLTKMFAGAMHYFPADCFCRICGDSPLVDPVDVRITIRTHEFAKNLITFGGYPGIGAVEVVDWKLFQRCLPDFTEEDREHVTLYFKRKCGLIVDHPEDFERIQHLFLSPQRSAQACLNDLAARL